MTVIEAARLAFEQCRRFKRPDHEHWYFPVEIVGGFHAVWRELSLEEVSLQREFTFSLEDLLAEDWMISSATVPQTIEGITELEFDGKFPHCGVNEYE